MKSDKIDVLGEWYAQQNAKAMALLPGVPSLGIEDAKVAYAVFPLKDKITGQPLLDKHGEPRKGVCRTGLCCVLASGVKVTLSDVRCRQQRQEDGSIKVVEMGGTYTVHRKNGTKTSGMSHSEMERRFGAAFVLAVDDGMAFAEMAQGD